MNRIYQGRHIYENVLKHIKHQMGHCQSTAIIAIITIIAIIAIIARADQLDAEFRAATGLAEKTEESVSALLGNI